MFTIIHSAYYRYDRESSDKSDSDEGSPMIIIESTGRFNMKLNVKLIDTLSCRNDYGYISIRFVTYNNSLSDHWCIIRCEDNTLTVTIEEDDIIIYSMSQALTSEEVDSLSRCVDELNAILDKKMESDRE